MKMEELLQEEIDEFAMRLADRGFRWRIKEIVMANLENDTEMKLKILRE